MIPALSVTDEKIMEVLGVIRWTKTCDKLREELKTRPTCQFRVLHSGDILFELRRPRFNEDYQEVIRLSSRHVLLLK